MSGNQDGRSELDQRVRSRWTQELQHAGGTWKRNLGLRYYHYPIPYEMNLKDAVAFVYGSSVQRDVHRKREILLGDASLLYLSDEKKVADDKMSGNTVTSEMTGEENDNSATDQMPDYSIDTPIDED